MGIVMEDIEKRLQVVEKNTTEILGYIKTDPTTKRIGIFETMQDTERRVRLLELDKKIQRVTVGGIAGVVSVIGVILGFMIQAWVNKNI